MDIYVWYQIVGGVFAGNILFAAFLYYLWQLNRTTKIGLKSEYMPIHVQLCGAVPPLVALGGLLLLA